LLSHSGRSRLITAVIEGQVDSGDDATERFISDLEAIPKELDFGSLKNAQPVIRSVVLRNITSEPIDVNAIYVEAADQAGYSLRTDCASLKPGQACVVVVTWSPVLRGQATGVLLVEHTGPTTLANIEMDGTFEPDETVAAKTFPQAVPGKGLLVSSQEDVDFGSGISTTSSITVSLVNVGDAPMTLTDVRLAGGDNGIGVGSRGCAAGTVLQPVEACPLTVSWSPVREGSIFDDVHIEHDGARGVLVLPVRGTSTGVISQDAKAVRLMSSTATASLGADGTAGEEIFVVRDKDVDPASVLDGFVVTSHSPTRAIISGPGGSRIVYNAEEVVIGGFLWTVNIRNSGVEFRSGPDKVLLLFDRSLSSVNRSSSQSGSGSSSSATTASTPSN
ncbi:MAG: choice-of-anchor D domain-containing protein, partial [Alphaproteobacteria bacterium]|nr:choice-of-anchor D domain-containing protein [Alphaproteobacteria bacterium]